GAGVNAPRPDEGAPSRAPGFRLDFARGLLDFLAQMLQRRVEHLVNERLFVLLLVGFLFLAFFRGPLLAGDDIAVVPPGGVLGTLLARQRNLHSGVGLAAPFVAVLAVGEAVDVLAAGPPVARRGQLQGALAVLHRDDVLHTALTVAPLANNHRSLVVLQTG